MTRDLNLSINMVGEYVSITVGEPESGETVTFHNELPIVGFRSDRIFDDVAEEIWSWVTMWQMQMKEGER